MNKQQQQIMQLIAVTAESLGHTLSEPACLAMTKELTAYPLEQVATALRGCMSELSGRLSLRDILQRLHTSDGHPERDEAWAIALKSTDEYETVSLTEQIQQALAAARPVLNLGDKIGARMAFLSAYDRLVSQARQQRQPVVWTLSLGFDASSRQRALQAAESTGRLTHAPDPILRLPSPEKDPTQSPGYQAIMAMLKDWNAEDHEQAAQRERDVQEAIERRRQEYERFAEGLALEKQRLLANQPPPSTEWTLEPKEEHTACYPASTQFHTVNE